ncbi:MAG TPA: DUF2231 domain-containing protein [Gemmatimonadaceae bacterium]|nr:DUF2231 domain-containing protein [Gemmatimonadaceae bacterium]
MPNIAPFHPQIVHFVIGLLFVAVAFRLVSLTPWFRFTNYAATTMLLIGAVSTWLAVRSGTAAHGPVERIPGARSLVQEHEEQGETTRNIFLGVAAIEILAWAFSRRDRFGRYAYWTRVASAVVGVVGCAMLYETAEHGGRIVYSFGGGPGLRTGDPADVERTYIAASYNQAQLERRNGNGAEAAAIINEISRRMPADLTVKFLRAESLLRDTKNPAAAKAALDSIVVPADDLRDASQKAQLAANIYLAEGKTDSARAVLQQALSAQPQNFRLKAKLDSIR